MASKVQKKPLCIGGSTKGLEANEYTNFRLARASKELKYWLSWPQDFTASTPSVKRSQGPLHTWAKSRDHEIVRAQKKASKGCPNTPPKSRSVVMDLQV